MSASKVSSLISEISKASSFEDARRLYIYLGGYLCACYELGSITFTEAMDFQMAGHEAVMAFDKPTRIGPSA